MLFPRPSGPKVPEPDALFWVIKILTTAMGEATSDYFVHRINPEVAVVFGWLALALALVVQFRVQRYLPAVYWFAVAMVAVAGTMAADVLHVRFGVPYVVSSAGFAVVLAAVFVAWAITEKTLSIHSITTRRRELFYWATVLATFALGTAVGDLTAYTLHLGFFASGVMFAAAFAVPGLAYRFAGLGSVVAFWSAYVLTRPLGASFADWFGVPRDLGGLDLGRGAVSLVLTALIVGFVGYLRVAGRFASRDVSARPASASASGD